jgi:hypothetical protein
MKCDATDQRGMSLIAAIFIIVILAFMGTMFVSLISTSTYTSLNDMQAAQAFYVAEGGVEFQQRELAASLDWYRSSTDPLSTATRVLGPGTFTASTNLPASELRRRVRSTDATASVYTTNRFPNAGTLLIGDDVASGAEYVRYTGIAGNTFTGLTRGITIGTITTAAATFQRGSTVYPVTPLLDALANACGSPASFRIAANSKFISAGIVDVEGEEISYSNSSTSGGTMTLTGVQRCQGPTPSAAHAVGQPVTPLLVGGVDADYQAEVISTGTAGAGTRIVKKTVQR